MTIAKVQDVNSSELTGNLVETTTDFQQYEKTDSQLSETTSIQHEFLSGRNDFSTNY